jgi:formylglycine-generating enzyme required for sulfatase activity
MPKYPWGSAAPTCSYAVIGPDGCGTTTANVGSHGAGKSPYGLQDMGGNVSEWVQDWYDEGWYGQSGAQDPKGPANGTMRVVRGGDGAGPPDKLRTAARQSALPQSQPNMTGFRCVMPIP